jgi:hypothetical protein
MSRKPIDQQQPDECRQAIWDFIRNRQGEPFTADDILYHVRLDAGSVRDYLTGLVNGGYLSSRTFKGQLHKIICHSLIKNSGIDAPRVRKDGSLVTQGIGQKYMWNAMTSMKVFTPADLAFEASTECHQVKTATAKSYCQTLCHFGYLRKQTKGAYKLIKRTGPKPPQIQRTKQVYDPNLRQVMGYVVEVETL